jgi:hypothetical protein
VFCTTAKLAADVREGADSDVEAFSGDVCFIPARTDILSPAAQVRKVPDSEVCNRANLVRSSSRSYLKAIQV